MLGWPLPEDAGSRTALMAHECWHRIQGEIGLAGTDPPCPQLDTLEGRYWIELEWTALRRALLATGEARRRAIGEAAMFRARRRSLFPHGAPAERALEMHEGLAEYTGFRVGLADTGEARRRVATALISAPGRESLVRSFAYLSGPAYGLLLDEFDAGWRRACTPTADLGEMLLKAAGLPSAASDSASATELARSYDAAGRLRRFEEERDRARRERMADWRHRLVEGPVLEIALGGFDYSFDPNGVLPLEGAGTVYPTLTASGAWGKIEVERGALITSDLRRLFVPAPASPSPEGSTIRGDGWTLVLAPGWGLRPAERAGSYVLEMSR
jgi:hypothetical protein